jgi:hypothetical protein
MTLPPETEWQCDCGLWLSTAYLRHTHVATAEQSLEEMIAARTAGADIAGPSKIEHVLRRKDHKTREKPL